MADIRQNATLLDDFNRAPEDPLSHGGDWLRSDTGAFPTALVLNAGPPPSATDKAGVTSGDMYWVPGDWSGDEAEAWGYTYGGGANGIAWAIDLWSLTGIGGSNTADGYRFRIEITGSAVIYRVTNGATTSIASAPYNPGYANGSYGMLIRRNGNDVEGWLSGLGLDLTTWSLAVSVTDTNYVNNLTGGIGVRDNSGDQLLGWIGFGAGPAAAWVPQIYRRIYPNLRHPGSSF